MFPGDEQTRADGIIGSLLAGFEGEDVDSALAALLSDVDDYDDLAFCLASRAVAALSILAAEVGADPWLLWGYCIS
jgi:hypothetical protein